ncbi:MarR family transcriptional regulator [Actinokineospora globicatena]|uniref:DNA-binding transcriptional regulator, MarR family n=1 Tax=Actinokineospora globicatena TaxID=103729 RepID=A0A9W6QKJ4_9PSEU|nr:MarR family transcriptional regulator [Actinokineospora globicatena]MCP2301293.1 hypothetical protein [Actinokineospora globicatena]GLW77068.1 hypothetical protein Aglo01_15500 [Actinokineospora globicatena]GLW83902.1 hypothetical protein Aglo02_15420 [Actinokineospora globicatena]GLW92153.1 hypothetical protein Aglo03_29690 [Actinokineospora globicatena]
MRPIGYWIKELDRRLEAGFERELGDVTRREWQVLNALPGDTGPFDGAEALRNLQRRGWVDGDQLTPAGEQAKADLGIRVARVREAVTAGVSEDEYRTTIRTLERMVGNLPQE